MLNDRIIILLLIMVGVFFILPYMHILGWDMEIERTMGHSWNLMIVFVIILIASMAIAVGLVLDQKRPYSSTSHQSAKGKEVMNIDCVI